MVFNKPQHLSSQCSTNVMNSPAQKENHRQNSLKPSDVHPEVPDSVEIAEITREPHSRKKKKCQDRDNQNPKHTPKNPKDLAQQCDSPHSQHLKSCRGPCLHLRRQICS